MSQGEGERDSSTDRRRDTSFQPQARFSDETNATSIAEVAEASAARLRDGVTEAVNRASRWAGPMAEASKNPAEKKEVPTAGGPQGVGGNGMFADADNMRSAIRAEMGKKEYDISDFYFKTGIAQAIARNSRWQSVTLLIIAVNSLWIGFEIELNTEQNLNDAEWPFQVGEYFFCAFFVFEWFVRFFALETKLNGLRDKWFVFDACLVFMMVAETLVLPHVLTTPEETLKEDEEGSGGQDVGQFGMLRMLRLLRLTRMVRFMRSVPELVTLLKSMGLAGRPVLSTLLLLLCLLYTFGIIFKSQLQSPAGSMLHDKFGRLGSAMLTLLYQGTLLDSVGRTANPLLDEAPVLTGLFIIFILLSSFTVLNLLIGMVCEVVNVVALTEKEKAMVAYVKGKLMHVLEELDEDGNGTISKSEFDKLMEIPAAIQALQELGIDLPNLVSLSDHLFEEEELQVKEKRTDTEEDQLFELMNRTYTGTDKMGKLSMSGDEEIERAKLLNDDDEDDHMRSLQFSDHVSQSTSENSEGKCLTFGDFIEMVIRLRPDSHPSVVDCVDLRKLYLKGQKQITYSLENLEEMNAKLVTDIQRNICHHPLFIVICNHPEMRARMRGTTSMPISRLGTGSEKPHCWNRTSMPESRREDDRRKINVSDEAAGLSNRELQKVQVSRRLDKAEDDHSVSSREVEIPVEAADISERLKTRASNGYLGRHRAGQILSGHASSGGSSSIGSWSGTASASSSSRRPSEGKLARILAAAGSSSSSAASKAADFSKNERAWQLDEVFLKDNKTRQLDKDVLGRVLDAASVLCDEDEDWAIGTPKAFFRSGREQTNTTGTGSATTGSPADVEAESSYAPSQGISVADETVDISGFETSSPMVQTPRALQSILARHKASRGSEEEESPWSSRIEILITSLSPFRLIGTGGAAVEPFSTGTPTPETSRSQAAPLSDQVRAEAYCTEAIESELQPTDYAGAEEEVLTHEISQGCPSDVVPPISDPMNAVTHVSGVTPIEVLVDDDEQHAASTEGLTGMFSCTPSSLCCGQTNVAPSPVPVAAV